MKNLTFILLILFNSSSYSENNTKARGSNDLNSNLIKNNYTLPNNYTNPAERAQYVHYIGTGKSIDNSGHKRDVPFRTYFASCAVDTDRPRMFISQTLKDISPAANPDHPRIGSVYEAEFNPQSGKMELTGNQTVMNLCNETHDIVASEDCSKVAVLCATKIEQPTSETYAGEFRDLVSETSSDSYYTNQVNNVSIINGISGLTQEEREVRYEYNGEMWLLEWSNPNQLASEPDKYVIHKGYGGGSPHGAPTLAYSEADNSYAAAFVTNLFDENSGGRHRSAALMVIERDNWELNPNERGWGWACGDGHVFTIRAFWNPFLPSDESEHGSYAALCNSDGNKWNAANAGSMAIRYEDIRTTSIFEGGVQYLFPASNGGVSNGGAHHIIPVDETRHIGVLTAREMEPFNDPGYQAYIQRAEQSAIDYYGFVEAMARGLVGLAACNWYSDSNTCLYEYTKYEYSGSGRFPLFNYGFWSIQDENITTENLSKVGIFHTDSLDFIGRSHAQDDGSLVKWIAEDDDCMFGAPQLVDLKNGYYLLGYGKFQCISDGFHLRRTATNTVNTRSVATIIPKEYYLQIIDVKGNKIGEPTLISASGWGEQDRLISLGNGKAAWTYIVDPTLKANGNFRNPEQLNWEMIVFNTPEWVDIIYENGFE